MNNSEQNILNKEQTDKLSIQMSESCKDCADLLESALPFGNYDNTAGVIRALNEANISIIKPKSTGPLVNTFINNHGKVARERKNNTNKSNKSE